MDPVIWSVAVASGVFLATLVSLEAGFRWGTRDAVRFAGLAHEGVGAMEASAFALFGLLLGFSFAGASSRLESKRALIVTEANAIGTSYLRVDLLPSGAQPAVRQQYKRLLDARLGAYENRGNGTLVEEDFAVVAAAQRDIWTLTVQATAALPADTASLVLAPVNEMIDISAARAVAFKTHLPPLIVGFLVGVAALTGLLAGYGMAKRRARSWFHLAVYAGLVSLTVYTVLDLDHPRFGLINIETAYRPLADLRSTIK